MTPLCASSGVVACATVNALMAVALLAVGAVCALAAMAFVRLLNDKAVYVVRSRPLRGGWTYLHVVVKD
jgi:hypothetical protein